MSQGGTGWRRHGCKELTKGAVGFRIKPSFQTDQIHQSSSPYRHGILFNQPRAVIIGIRWNRLCNHHHGGSGMRSRSGHHPRRVPLESPDRAATHRTSDPLLPGHSALRLLHPRCADVLRQPQPDPLGTQLTLTRLPSGNQKKFARRGAEVLRGGKLWSAF
jgi:hypothetical protein